MVTSPQLDDYRTAPNVETTDRSFRLVKMDSTCYHSQYHLPVYKEHTLQVRQDRARVVTVPITLFVTALRGQHAGSMAPRSPDTAAVPIDDAEQWSQNGDEPMPSQSSKWMLKTHSLRHPLGNEISDEEGLTNDRTVILPCPNPEDTLDTYDI